MPDVIGLYSPLRFADKVRVLAAMVLSALVFATAGWRVLAPFDPYDTVSFWTERQPLLTALTAFGLALVLAGVGGSLAGKKLPDFGIFVAAFGLAFMNLKSGTMEGLLAAQTGSVPAARGALCMKLIGELWIWTALVIGAGVLAGLAVAAFRANSGPGGKRSPAIKGGSGLDEILPRLRAAQTDAAQLRQEIRSGLSSAAVATVAAAVIISLSMSHSAVGAIVKGQVYFAIGAAFFGGALLGHQMFHPIWCVWSYLPVPILATIGYGLGWMNPDVRQAIPRILSGAREQYNLLPTIPPNDFASGTPLEYVAVGVAAAIAGFWFSRHTHRLRAESEE